MPRARIAIGPWLWAAAAAALVAWLAGPVMACPTCKDSLTHDPATANLARGYAYSILFMLSMPPLIFSGLAAYFYWEVRRARRAAATSVPSAAVAAEHSLVHG
jgi:heme/copper-type cytochrome/quinol oxidase subunit 2